MLVVVAASDPGNLLSTIVTGAEVPRVASSRVLYMDGVPIATSRGGEMTWLVTLDGPQVLAASRALSLGQ